MSDIEFIVDDLPVVDRSTVETWGKCPRQAAYNAAGQFTTAGDAAASGEEVHTAIGMAITDYIESGGNLGTNEIRDCIVEHVYHSRPDVQPDAVDGLVRYAWQIASLIGDHNPLNILRYDGGTGERSGQLAADFGDVRLTAEMDLLLATESPQVVALHDWKSGRKFWTHADVATSFQFQFYAWLVLKNYPAIECVEIRVHNTRSHSHSWLVEFQRRDMDQWSGRISRSLAVWREHHGKSPEDAPAWPTRDKCRLCDAAAVCGAPDPDIAEARRDPAAYLRWTIQIQQSAAERLKHLGAIVEETGEPVTTPEGDCYGFAPSKPSSRKPAKKIYTIEVDDE